MSNEPLAHRAAGLAVNLWLRALDWADEHPVGALSIILLTGVLIAASLETPH